MQPTGHVDVKDFGRVRVVTLNHQEKRNALTRDMLEALKEIFSDVGAVHEEGPRAFVLTGAPDGKAFSSGFDLRGIEGAERARGLDPIGPAAHAIANCALPVIAAANGHVFGGALELLISCHVRVGQADMKLGVPATKLGLIYASAGLGRFVAALPRSQVLRLFLTGETLDGEEATRIGLLDVMADDAYVEGLRLANLMAENAPLAVRGTLDAVRRITFATQGRMSSSDLDVMKQARLQSVQSEDLSEGVAAFSEKRRPDFRGH